MLAAARSPYVLAQLGGLDPAALGFASLVIIAALVLITVVIMFYLTIRGATPEQRLPLVTAFATILRALAEVVRAIADIAAKITRAMRGFFRR